MTLWQYRWIWRALLLAVVLAEVSALTNPHAHDTLSERTWWLCRVPHFGPVFRCLGAAFGLWLITHLFFIEWVPWYGRALVVWLAIGAAAWMVWATWSLVFTGKMPHVNDPKSVPAVIQEAGL